MVARHVFDSSLPVISFNYHIIGFYRRGAGCRAANEGAGWHAELRAFLHRSLRFDGVCASARPGEGRGGARRFAGCVSASEEFTRVTGARAQKAQSKIY